MSLNKHKIIPLIESYYHTFTPLERTIADFFIHNTEEQDFSSRNISGLLYVSEASLSRFAQKCGFHGYREFIYEYKQSLAPGPEENIPNFEVSEFNTYQELLNKSNALLDKAQITRITNLLVSKSRVYVYGRGSSGLVAQEMKLRFMRIGLNIEAVTDSHIMKVNSVILDENCLVIGISVSGQTDDIISSLKAAHQHGAYTLLMTARQDKSYQDFCDETLIFASSHIMKVNSVILDENCLVIGISVSGQTDDIISSLKAAHQHGAYTLLMTARQDKSYQDFCDETLIFASMEHLEYGNIISPQFPILLVLDVLYAHYLQIDRSKKEALHEYTIQTLQPFLIK